MASPAKFGLAKRLTCLGLLFALELIALSILVDRDSLDTRTAWILFIHDWGQWALRLVVGFSVIFATFTYLNNRCELLRISTELTGVPVRWMRLAGHGTAMLLFAALSLNLSSAHAPGWISDALGTCWFLAGISGIALASLAVIPWHSWVRLVSGSGYLWLFAFLAIALAYFVGRAAMTLWVPLTRVTFHLVSGMLSWMVPQLTVDPATLTIETPNFRVSIAPECSGFEGIGLIVAFGLTWLWFFRRECRFPHALLLLPAGIVLVFFLNALRIAALVLIGNAGAEEAAVNGFHSQAGWIGFNAVALGFSLAARRVPWISKRAEARTEPPSDHPASPYIVPFLVLLAAGMLVRAATGGFEWLYPLRFVAAACALFAFRHRLALLNRRCGPLAILTGAVIFGIWIVVEGPPYLAGDAMPAALRSASMSWRDSWIAVRVLTSVLIVPVAEELAFRGFLMRRLISADFESVSTRRFSLAALAVSSVFFGVLHGGHFVSATLAGCAYGLVLLHKGRIGDAVAAHAVTNASIAAYVLFFHQWRYW